MVAVFSANQLLRELFVVVLARHCSHNWMTNQRIPLRAVCLWLFFFNEALVQARHAEEIHFHAGTVADMLLLVPDGSPLRIVLFVFLLQL